MRVLSRQECQILLESHGSEHNTNATMMIPYLVPCHNADAQPLACPTQSRERCLVIGL